MNTPTDEELESMSIMDLAASFKALCDKALEEGGAR